MSCVIVSEKPWAHLCVDEVRRKSGEPVQFIASPEALTVEALAAIQPRYVFFLHWSSYIPAAIYDAFPCVVFHMTDLPFGRGGSPLQNLIARGIYQTKRIGCRAGVFEKGRIFVWLGGRNLYSYDTVSDGNDLGNSANGPYSSAAGRCSGRV